MRRIEDITSEVDGRHSFFDSCAGIRSEDAVDHQARRLIEYDVADRLNELYRRFGGRAERSGASVVLMDMIPVSNVVLPVQDKGRMATDEGCEGPVPHPSAE